MTLLVSTSGVLLAVLAAVIGIYHSAVDGFCALIVVVDAVALAAMGCFMLAARAGLDAVGTLVLAVQVAEPSQDGEDPDELVRQDALRAKKWFMRGLYMAMATGVVAVIALNVIAAT